MKKKNIEAFYSEDVTLLNNSRGLNPLQELIWTYLILISSMNFENIHTLK